MKYKCWILGTGVEDSNIGTETGNRHGAAVVGTTKVAGFEYFVNLCQLDSGEKESLYSLKVLSAQAKSVDTQ